MDIISAYREVGTYRGAAEIAGTTPKTVKRVIDRQEAGGAAPERAVRGRNYDGVVELVAARVAKTAGRISAKRLLPAARAAGYVGSPRNFRRLVAAQKQLWRNDNHRGRRPAVWSPGEHLVIDWGVLGGLHVFCAVLAWCRVRFVRFAADERAETTLGLLAECFEVLGGVPGVVLADRMGCLKGGVVANRVVPTPQYLRLAAHYGFRPDFCEANDPQSKGIVENLVGYAKRDLIVPQAPFTDLAAANKLAAAWCVEVNAVVHSEICAVPAEQLVIERELLAGLPSLRPSIGRVVTRKVDRLSCVRFGSARYSVPTRLIGTQVGLRTDDGRLLVIVAGVGETGEVVAEHILVAPGEASVLDEHYGGPRPAPRRAVRPKTVAEKQFCTLGPMAEAFITGAAAAGNTRLGPELAELNTLRAAHGEQPFLDALGRAVAFGRWRANDVRSILAAGAGTADPSPAGDALVLELPVVPVRSLADYAIGGQS
jgi:transposase